MTSMIDVPRTGLAGSVSSADGLRLTPYEAMVADLLFVSGELEMAGIPFLLIRGADGRPALIVDIALRARVAEALMAACLEAPLRAKIFDGTGRRSVDLADSLLSTDPDPRLLRVFRQRQCPRSGVRYGASAGVELQFWVFDGQQAICPIENSLTRKALPLSDVEYTSVELHGRTWSTIDGMFTPHAGDITFDIDMVFSWVDGNDPEFRSRRAAAMANHVVGEGDDADARIRQIDELKYALRSVHAFAPWVRRIFIATDSRVPEWLAPHPKITIVRAEEHFTDLSALPVYNSHAVETQLHHIPGLAEHFLYSNDDMFFGRPLSPTMFFSPGGVTKFIEAGTRIGLGVNHPERSGFENAARVNRQLLWEKFGKIITRHLEHTAAPLRKSVLAELEREFAEDFARTQASRFRSSTDISVTNSLYHYYSLLTGRAVQNESAKVLYVDTTLRSGLAKLPKLLKKRKFDFFCLNDGSFPEVSADERARLVGEFLESYFPVPAPWEQVAGEE
ncbi:sugar phosphotransferase [Mycobacterium branderi]|uniref:Exopolysaccharide phosphotransferase CpsY n=2 Tax=Mycobacterium branderi TaxID=43348 RepID=A0A7I7WCA8_9MYCO|nr:stealth family protein [Mycobacterium branderi]ORA37550.1 sugar phosphotransferase [Mycobacterium branderi]BBZ13518.1 exopolysaccharide phosphotransferase CpsY [Mycobacterium branderi]